MKKTNEMEIVTEQSTTEADNSQVVAVLNLIFQALDVPESRRGSIFGNKHARRAAVERIGQSGFDETKRVLNLYLLGVKNKEAYRPSFTTATQLLTNGWAKTVAFTDTINRGKKTLNAGNQDVRDEIVKGLASGGAN